MSIYREHIQAIKYTTAALEIDGANAKALYRRIQVPSSVLRCA